MNYFCPSVHTGHILLLSPSAHSAAQLGRRLATPLSLCLSVFTAFPQRVFIATRAKLVLCTSAGILKLHRGGAVRKIHSTSPSPHLPQNCTISSKTVVSTALVVAVNLWHVTAWKLFRKWQCFLSEGYKKKRKEDVCWCMLP